MRAAFLFLLLANAALFAWWRSLAYEEAAEPPPLSRQIEPQKVRVIPPERLPPPVARKAAPPPAVPVALKCLEWGSFTIADAPRAEKILEPLALGPRLAQRHSEEMAGWWVFIPRQTRAPNVRQAALKKAAELRKLGVEDYFIVQEEGEHRWAISLGVFRTEDAAQAHLAALRTQGVRSARVGPRETIVPKVWLQVKGVDAPLEAKLRELTAQTESTELRLCPNPNQ